MKKSFEDAGRRARRRPQQSPPTGRYRYVRMRWRLLFALVDGLGWLVVQVWRLLAARFSAAPARPFEEPRSILLVQLDHLGDAVMTAAVLPALRRQFPQARLEILAAEWNRELFTACPEVDRVHVSRVNRFARDVRGAWIFSTCWWGWRLRRRRFDLAIDVRGEFPHALILWLSGAKRRLGWDCGGGDFLLTDRARFVPGRAEIESRLALLAALGIEADQSVRLKRPWFKPGASACAAIERRLAKIAGPSTPLVVLHVSAGTQAKRWPADHWRELLGRLILDCDARVALIGVREERATAETITLGMNWPKVVDWTGQLSLVETAALIAEADVFIGADSGPAHLAAAVGTPAIVLFSGTNRVEQWRPWGGQVAVLRHETACSPCHRQTCPWAEHPCMSGLTPEAVMRQLRQLRPALVEPPPDEACDPALSFARRSRLTRLAVAGREEPA